MSQKRSIVFLIALAAILLLLADNIYDIPANLASSVSGTKPTKETCALKPKEPEFNKTPFYQGPLIDAHVHMPVSSRLVASVGRQMGFEHMPAFGGKLTPSYLACLFKSEGITQVFGFFMATKFNLGAEVNSAKVFERNHAGLIVPFFMPATNDTLRVATSTVKSTLQKNKGLFRGIGEIKMFDNGSILRPFFLSHYDLASAYGIPVMLHPYEKHQTEIIELLKRYPTVKFLFHGGHDADWVTGFMGNHPNVYYSIDADMVGLYGSGGPREGKKEDLSKEEFVAYFRGHFDEVLKRALSEWKARIESNPDRFMWGTDRWYDWHFDQDVGGLLEEFGRSFIGQLSPSVQENFAYKNAEKFLGK